MRIYIRKFINNYIPTFIIIIIFTFLIRGIYRGEYDESEKINLINSISEIPNSLNNILGYQYLIYIVNRDISIENLALSVKQNEKILKYNNPILRDKNYVKSGTRIVVYKKDVILYRMGDGESLEDVQKKFKVDYSKIKLNRYDKKYIVIDNPVIEDELLVKLNDRLKESINNNLVYRDIKVVKNNPTYELEKEDERVKEYKNNESIMCWPVNSSRITSKFGERKHPILRLTRFHRGVDIGAPKGMNVLSAISGRVTYSGRKGGYGNFIEIVGENGIKTRYGHLSKILVSDGDRIEKGKIIGLVGSTGFSTGPHLHFEILVGDKVKNPMEFKYY